MTQKKVKIKRNKTPNSISQSNSMKTYSFNPFQPFETKIQTQSGIIRIKKNK